MSSSLYAKIFNEPPREFSALDKIESIDKTRILKMTISGGEPSIIEPVTNLLSSAGAGYNLQEIKFPTNCSRPITEIVPTLETGIKTIVSMSIDGTGPVFEYCRWPIKWDKFERTVDYYLELREKYSNLVLDFMMAASSLSAPGYEAVLKFGEAKSLKVSHNFVYRPHAIRLASRNPLTLHAKEMLEQSTYRQARELAQFLAIEDYDSTDELRAFITDGDRRRGTNFNETYSKFGVTL